MADLNERALDAALSAYPVPDMSTHTLGAMIETYLAAAKAEKPARVDPAANPNKRTYVGFVEFRDVGEEEKSFPTAYVVTDLSAFEPGTTDTLLKAGVDLLCATTHAASWNAGWYVDPKTGVPIERNVGEVIALMHSELSEGLEGYRKGLMDDHLPHRLQLEVEFADAVIRIADTCGHLGLDLSGAIIDKMRYNATRLDHKLEARAAGGKSF